MTMHLGKATSILQEHNDWRKGAEREMLQPKILSEAIDAVVDAGRKYHDLTHSNNLLRVYMVLVNCQDYCKKTLHHTDPAHREIEDALDILKPYKDGDA